MTDYLITVVIPTYNRAKYLPEALESVFIQNIPLNQKMKVVVVDDGSTDNTHSVIQQFGELIHYVYQANQGTAMARNEGLRHAEGEFVCFLDSDDIWLPQKVQQELDWFERFPEAEAIVTDNEHWYENELTFASRFEAIGLFLKKGAPQFLEKLPYLWMQCSLFSTCCLIIRRTVLSKLETPFFDPSFILGEDWDFEVRMYHQCNVLFCPDMTAQVRRFEDGTRTDRPIPGKGERSPAYEKLMLGVKKRVLERALTLNQWSPPVKNELQNCYEAVQLQFTPN